MKKFSVRKDINSMIPFDQANSHTLQFIILMLITLFFQLTFDCSFGFQLAFDWWICF